MHIHAYLRHQLDHEAADVSLCELPVESPCGADCVKVIDAARAMIAVSDPLCHDAIVAAAERAVGIYWRG